MANNLGSLTVALGLDAADYTRGLNKAERDAYEFGREVGEQIRSGVAIATGALAALGIAAERSFAFIRNQASAIDAFNDLRDATGSSIENISALDQVARQTGGTFATAESVLLKFNTALKAAKPNSEAEAALKALNLNIGELKALDPAEALRRTSVAFAQFETDANKARAMQILFGKSVKEVAPFLGDLAEQTQLVGTTSAATAAQAEMFNKQIDMLKANAEDAGRSIVSNLLPALNQFLMNAKQIQQMGGFGVIVKDAAREFVGMDPLMTGDNGADIRRAMKERDRLQKDLAWQQGKGRPTRSVEDSLAENARLLGVLRIKQKNEVDMLNFGQSYGDAVSRRFEQAAKLPEILKPPKIPKGSKGNEAAEAREALGLDLDAIRLAADEQINVFRNAEKLLSAERAAGLKDESAYYAERIRLSQQVTAAQEDAARATVKRLQQEDLTGKDAIANTRKIAQEEAKLLKIQADGATTVQVFKTEQIGAYNRIEESILAAKQAAQGFLEVQGRSQARSLAGIGLGAKSRERDGQRSSIEEDFQRQRATLAGQRSQAEMYGPLSADAVAAYEKRLGIMRDTEASYLQSLTAFYAEIDAKQADWKNGATEALFNYADEAKDAAKMFEEAFTGAFRGLEDQLTQFATTGKADFKSLADSIIADVTRITVRQQITGPLAEWLGGTLKGGGSAGGGAPWLTGLMGLFGGGRANGGPVQAGRFYEVNENAPELLDVNGRQLLMMGNRSGRVIPMDEHRGGGGMVQNNTYVIEGQVDRRTQTQISSQVRRDTYASARLA